VPRARNIKPSIMDNEELADLSPATRLLFIYLWMLADREGRLEDRPRRIGAQALPYDRDVDVDDALQSLHDAGFIQRYQVGDLRVIQILTFSSHQHPHMKEKPSELPAYDAEIATETEKHQTSPVQAPDKHQKSPSDSLIPDSLIPDSSKDSCAEPKGSPPDVEAGRDILIRLPTNKHNTQGETFDVTRQMADEYGQIYPAVNIEQALRNMLGWCLANPSKRKTHGGTPKFINAWLAKDQNSGGHHATNHRPTDRPRAPTPAERVQAKRARAPGGASDLGAVGADVRDVRPYLVTGSGR